MKRYCKDSKANLKTNKSLDGLKMKTVKAWWIVNPDNPDHRSMLFYYDKIACEKDCYSYNSVHKLNCKVVAIQIREIKDETSKS